MLDWRNELPALVRAELPAHVADAFDRLPLRPAIRLTPARPGDPVVGRLGGEADLPIGQEWPLRDDGEPEIFVARLDCAVLSAYEVDLELPGSGTLLFFLPRLEEMEEVVRSGRPTVIHVPEGIATAARQVPSHLRHPSEEYEYPLVALTARTILSAPGSYNPAMAEDPAAIADLSRLLWRDEYNGRYLSDIVRRYRGFIPDHQVGGYSDAFQHPLEMSAAHHGHRSPAGTDPYQDPAFLAEARQWVTLLQLDEDDDARMIWGDGAVALWAIRRADLAARDFGATFFTVDGH
ncbi:DUF1963 domain-containing protein [Actinoplanes regularis]|uniref:DUF1963 domain-containing protein n=1 Tax=Actinoplanes regularis TaxID=52697 RepID=UPI0015C69287|nr:YwqG family protein [Actinoplanes regularis]GIE91295.1 hypothetical protein Are01nite_77750 [Actinoplanes regularis]